MQGSGTDRNDTGQTARNIVLRQLSSAPKTRQQLSEKLADREIPEEIIREVLDRVEEVELIDDAAFAQSWVRSRHRAKWLARRALSMELRRSGVDEHNTELALKQLSDDDEHAKAHELAVRKLSRTNIPYPTDPAARKQRDRIVRRLVGMLSRKGYSPGMAFSVVNDAMDTDEHYPFED